MSPRVSPVTAVASLLLAVSFAACSAAGTSSGPAGQSATPARTTTPTNAPATPTPTATILPDTGDVSGPATPGLTVEPVGGSTIRVTLADPSAKAWRLTVSAEGSGTADSWALTVETGDVAPVITTVDTMNGVPAEPREQTGLEAGATSGRVCSVAVPVCIRAASVVLPQEGNGTLVLEIGRTDTNVALSVAGATAVWPAEPFVLGSWTTTTPFPWGP